MVLLYGDKRWEDSSNLLLVSVGVGEVLIYARRLTNHSTGRGDNIPFMVLSAIWVVWIRAAPVKSGVRLRVEGGER